MAMKDDLARLVRPLVSRVTSMIKRAIIERVDDSQKTALVQVSLLDDEVSDKCEYLQPFGLSFRPPAGSEAIAFSPGGDPSQTVVVCANNRGDRPTGVDEGQGGLYEPGGTWLVFLPGDGTVHLGAKSASDALALASKVDDRIKSVEDKVNTFIGTFNQFASSHTHSTSMGPSGTPTPPGNESTMSNGSGTGSSKVKAD